MALSHDGHRGERRPGRGWEHPLPDLDVVSTAISALAPPRPVRGGLGNHRRQSNTGSLTHPRPEPTLRWSPVGGGPGRRPAARRRSACTLGRPAPSRAPPHGPVAARAAACRAAVAASFSSRRFARSALAANALAARRSSAAAALACWRASRSSARRRAAPPSLPPLTSQLGQRLRPLLLELGRRWSAADVGGLAQSPVPAGFDWPCPWGKP